MPPTPEVLARAHDREFARMNERRPRKPGAGASRCASRTIRATLGVGARIVPRGWRRVALAPLALARAVVDRIRSIATSRGGRRAASAQS